MPLPQHELWCVFLLLWTLIFIHFNCFYCNNYNLVYLGLSDGTSASSLRRQICAFIAKNPKLLIADTPLADWVKWDSRGSVSSYVSKMSHGENTTTLINCRLCSYDLCKWRFVRCMGWRHRNGLYVFVEELQCACL